MSAFIGKLVISPACDDESKWALDESLIYSIDKGDTISVPAGFVTDFASIPQIFWNILPPFGKYGEAAVVHDYLYKSGVRPKAECDHIFLEAMGVLGVSWITSHTMYWAVKYFGQKAWEAHRKEDANAV